MPPAFVYLIPEDFVGPVFTLFGQPDGVEMKPDPLGHAVAVPADGIIKIRAPRLEVMGVTVEGYRATWFIAVSASGERRDIPTLTNVYRDDGIFWQGIIDEKTDMQKYAIGERTTGTFDHLPKKFLKRRMIASRRNCKFRFDNADGNDKNTHCDQFEVMSPEEIIRVNHLMDSTGTYVQSVADFLERARELNKQTTALLTSSPTVPQR